MSQQSQWANDAENQPLMTAESTVPQQQYAQQPQQPPPQQHDLEKQQLGAPPEYTQQQNAQPQQYAQQPQQYAQQPQQYGRDTMTVVTTVPQYGAVVIPVPNDNRPAPPNCMIASILACIFCAWPCGVGAIIFSSKQNQATRYGDIFGAYKHYYNVKIFLVLSVLSGIALIAVLYFMGYFEIWFDDNQY